MTRPRQATMSGMAVLDLLKALRCARVQPEPLCRAVGLDVTSLDDSDAHADRSGDAPAGARRAPRTRPLGRAPCRRVCGAARTALLHDPVQPESCARASPRATLQRARYRYP